MAESHQYLSPTASHSQKPTGTAKPIVSGSARPPETESGHSSTKKRRCQSQRSRFGREWRGPEKAESATWHPVRHTPANGAARLPENCRQETCGRKEARAAAQKPSPLWLPSLRG